MQPFINLSLLIISVVVFLSSKPQQRIIMQQFTSSTVTETPNPTSTATPSLTLIPTPTTKLSLTPTPTVTPIKISNKQLDNWFTSYSNQFSVSKNQLVSIAVCESKLNPNAKNGDYAGLFQFASQTWKTARKNMNLDQNPDLRFNPEESIRTAAFQISTGSLYAWKNCVK